MIDMYSGSDMDWMAEKLYSLENKVHLGRVFVIQGEALECCMEDAYTDGEEEYNGYPYHR